MLIDFSLFLTSSLTLGSDYSVPSFSRARIGVGCCLPFLTEGGEPQSLDIFSLLH